MNKTAYDFIYLSPHLDDVVLSCAGQIYEKRKSGQTVLIVTIMAGDPPSRQLSPFAQNLHRRWKLGQNPVAGRRQEDIEACSLLQVDFLHWDVPDCIYRFDPTTGEYLYQSDPDLFGDLARGDYPLIDDLVSRLHKLPLSREFVIPLAAGHHVDHQLVRCSAERWLASGTGVSRTRPFYYEDYPYVRDPASLIKALDGDRLWRQKVFPLTRQALTKKIAAISVFRSQQDTFFKDEIDLALQVRSYTNRVSGERLWYKEEDDGESADCSIGSLNI